MTIPALPSAEPPTVSEKHQLSEETPTDLISRQNAIDILDEFEADIEVGKRDAYKTHREKLLSIHSAYHPLCALADRECPFQGNEYAWCLTCPHISEKDRELVKKAVAEPKTGKWVRSHTGTIGEGFYCSRCGKHGYKTDFCPNCGADMRSKLRQTTDTDGYVDQSGLASAT